MSEQPVDLAELERPILELEAQMRALEMDPAKAKEREKLAKKVDKLKSEVFANISDWQRAQLARHPKRPYALDYLGRICTQFEELHGDRNFADDAAIVGGLAWIEGRPLMVICHQKGRDTKQKIQRNFGMPRPEGYRKALRLMKMAEKFRRPILTLLDTPGAYPGMDAAKLRVPTLSVIIGEGGSGGALALGVTDRILMLEYAIYSVISPEGCASILWKDASQAPAAAAALKLTAPNLLKLGIIDEVIPEPLGGAHSDWDGAAELLKASVLKNLDELGKVPGPALVDQRYQKFARMGQFGS